MQVVRFLLFPFAVLYNIVTSLRNWAFDIGFLRQHSFNIPVIAVGNLSTGGTGKTPMIEYLLKKYYDKRVAVLSRGYGRKTQGFLEVQVNHDVTAVGDEPAQIKNKFGDEVVVAVCENRVQGINHLLAAHDLDFILLDDAFQHRYVKASSYVLLSSFDKPYFKDFLLPTGNLRESQRGVKRANHIVITKCPDNITQQQQTVFLNEIKQQPQQQVYFAGIKYADFVLNEFDKVALENLKGLTVSVVTGIANPAPLLEYLESFIVLEHDAYGDHHAFTDEEVKRISERKLVITTEKDYMRLRSYNCKNIFYLPMETYFIGNAL